MNWFTRDATKDDLDTIQNIYSYYVVHTTSSFEYEAPTVEEMERRFNDIKKKGLPFLVVGDNDTKEVYGYAYATTYKVRAAYNNSVEDSIFLRHGFNRKGLGTILLQELIKQCTVLGLRQMIAHIGHEDLGSVALHKKLGFEHKGTVTAIGYKLNTWIDMSCYQLTLGDGSNSPPSFVLGGLQ